MDDLKWYEYSQNNPGGSFIINDQLCHRLFIQAVNIDEANRIAESKGVYFNGCEQGLDCNCCGDRWHEPYKELIFPIDYTSKEQYQCVEEYAQALANRFGWTTPDARIFYKEGKIVEINILQ